VYKVKARRSSIRCAERETGTYDIVKDGVGSRRLLLSGTMMFHSSHTQHTLLLKHPLCQRHCQLLVA
jgi:hypothetical protein